MKWIALPLVAVIAGTILFVMSLPEGTPDIDKAQEGRPVTTIRIQGAASHAVHVFTCSVAAPVELALGFRVGGKISMLRDEIGDVFEKGDMLARLEKRDYRLQLDAAEAKLRALELRIEQLERDRARSKQLFAEKVISRQRHEQLVTELKNLKAQRSQARDNRDLAQRRLQYCELLAPFSGTIAGVAAEAGEVVQRGRTVLVLLSQEQHECITSVPGSFVNALKPGTKAEVVLDLWPDTNLPAEVQEVARSAGPLSAYRVRLLLTGTELPDLREGMLGNVRFLDDSVSGYLLPLNAIMARNGKQIVWRVDTDTSTVHARQVQTGALSGDRVRITAGLQDGDLIVVRGVQHLRENMQVTLSSSDNATAGLGQ